MTGHFLVLKGLAGILTAAGGAVRTVRNGNAMRSAQPSEIPALHRPGKAFADRNSGRVHELTGDEMISREFGADRNKVSLVDPELSEFALGLDFRGGEMAARGFCQALRLARSRSDLHGDIAVPILRA